MDLFEDIKRGRLFEKNTSEAYERGRKLLKYNLKALFLSYHSLKSQLIYLTHPFLGMYQLMIDILRLLYSVFLFTCAFLMLKFETANDRFVDFLINMGAIGLEFAAVNFAFLSLITRSLTSICQMQYFYKQENDITFKVKGWSLEVTHENALNKSFLSRQIANMEEIGSDFSQELKHHRRAYTFA
jgi:hypothetical protein